MPLLHCTTCHHEYEGPKDRSCDWCGAEGRVLDEKTDLGRMMSDPRRIRRILEQLRQGNDVSRLAARNGTCSAPKKESVDE